jgi:hypothetical protein
MHFGSSRFSLYPASLAGLYLVGCMGLLSFVGCGGVPASVTPPPAQDFTIASSPSTLAATAGAPNSSFTVSITGKNGFTGSVAVTISGLPAGATTSPASPFNLPAGSSQIVSLSVPASAPVGNFMLTLSGTSAALNHSASLALTVNPEQDFSIAPSPSTITVAAGTSSSNFSVSIAGQNGFADSVMVTLSGLPVGVTSSPASPFSVAAGSSQTVTLSFPPSVSSGHYPLTLSGTSGALTHSSQFMLTVDPAQDFSIAVNPTALSATAGGPDSSFAVSIGGQNGFSDTVKVTLSGLPAGATTSPASPFNVAAGASQTVTLSVPATQTAGDFTVTASGTSTSLTHAVQLGLTILGQLPVTTWHYNNARTSANTWESELTPSNVNSTTFGMLFTKPVDGFVVGQPLYLPSLNIPGQGVHNVVYVATMHDSVYAFDADSSDPTPLWMNSILDYSPVGATPVPAAVTKETVIGWTEVGIISTPVIDPVIGTLYLVAETYESGNVVHRLHALDVTTGQEKLGGPTTIAATYTLNGVTTTFADSYQINRPGLLLANGHIYLGFGSNCCNDYSQGWMLSYNAATLRQEGAYTVEPGHTLGSIWQKGAGLSSDSSGHIYAETAEGPYAAGTNLSISVLKLSQAGSSLTLADWFTPYNYQYLSDHDRDLNNAPLILPDQAGPYPHELIAEGKEGTIYVLNRDNMGQLCTTCTTGDTQIVQEIPQGAGKQSGNPVYWNNTVYFTGTSSPVSAYALNNGTLTVPPSVQSIQIGGGGHAIVTANGNSNGILWFINGGSLWAMDAITLMTLYTSDQAANSRDTLPPLAHFATPIAADGKVFIGTQNSLVVYGVLSGSASHVGNGHSNTVASGLKPPFRAQTRER